MNYEASLNVKPNGKNQIKGCQKNFWFDKKELISLEKKKVTVIHTHTVRKMLISKDTFSYKIVLPYTC